MWLWRSYPRTSIYLLWPKTSRAGLEIWPTLGLIESPGPVEQRDGRRKGGQREGWSEGKGTECLAGRRGADQFSPLAYQSCPLTLSVSADDTLSLPIGPFPGQEKQKKKRRRRWRCVHWPQSCMFERACREGERTLPRVVRAGFCQAVLSPRTVSEQTRGPSGELHSSSSPPNVPAEVAASKALSVHNALEASSS